jgi:hypothetical protein
LETEGFKRVHAVQCAFNENGLTVIGGGNGEGKTSFLDSAIWALGGDRYKPSSFLNDEAEKVSIRLELSNGLIVERKGVNGTLKITSADGRGGQALLNEFVNLFALNLPKFMASTGTEKAKLLLDAFPDLGPRIQKLNVEAKRIYDERHALGVISDRKAKYASELPFDPEAP